MQLALKWQLVSPIILMLHTFCSNPGEIDLCVLYQNLPPIYTSYYLRFILCSIPLLFNFNLILPEIIPRFPILLLTHLLIHPQGHICKYILAFLCLVTQLCPTLCDPVDHSLPGSSVLGDYPGKNTGVSCHALLQGIFPTQGSNPGLPHCRPNSLPSELQGKPKNTGMGSLFLLQGILPIPKTEPGSPALQVDSSSTELPGKPPSLPIFQQNRIFQLHLNK